jgi:hypothetical protein
MKVTIGGKVINGVEVKGIYEDVSKDEIMGIIENQNLNIDEEALGNALEICEQNNCEININLSEMTTEGRVSLIDILSNKFPDGYMSIASETQQFLGEFVTWIFGH